MDQEQVFTLTEQQSENNTLAGPSYHTQDPEQNQLTSQQTKSNDCKTQERITGVSSYIFQSSEICASQHQGNSCIKSQILNQEGIETILMENNDLRMLNQNLTIENENLKAESQQLKKQLLKTGAQSSSSQGTQEQEFKKNPEQQSLNKNSQQAIYLVGGLVQKFELKAIEKNQLEAMRIKFQEERTLRVACDIQIKQLREVIKKKDAQNQRNVNSHKKKLSTQLYENQKLRKKLQSLRQQYQMAKDIFSNWENMVNSSREEITSFQEKYNYYYDENFKNEQKLWSLIQEINLLKAEIATYALESSKNQESKAIQKQKYSKIEQQFSLLKSQKENLQVKLKTLETSLENLESQKINLLAKIRALEESLGKVESQKVNLLTKVRTLEASLERLESQKVNLLIKIRTLETSLEKANQQAQKQKQQNETIRQQIQKLNDLNKKSNQQNEKLTQQYKKTKLQIEKLTQQLKKQKGELEKLKQENTKWKQQNAKLIEKSKQQMDKSKQQIEKLRKEKESEKLQYETQIKAAMAERKSLTSNLQKTKDQLSVEKRQHSANRSKLQKQLILVNKLQNQLVLMKRENEQFSCSLKDYKQVLHPILQVTGLDLQVGKNELFPRFLRGSYFPDSAILNEQPISKTQFLYGQLTKFLQIPSKTFKTQLLFKYDTQNTQNNFFKYIYNKKHMLVLVKLINGVVLGGFSVFPFELQPQRPGKGFLFSLTAEKSFKMKKQPRTGVYTPDTYFLIIGNSQIRIKYTQNKFYSNFGVASATFQPNGFPKQEFLGTKDPNINELEFQTYEIYTLQTNEQ